MVTETEGLEQIASDYVCMRLDPTAKQVVMECEFATHYYAKAKMYPKLVAWYALMEFAGGSLGC